MQKSGIFSKIKTPILIGGLFSAFVYMYFTPNFAHASTSFLMLFTDPQKIFFVGAMLVGLFLADTGTKIKKLILSGGPGRTRTDTPCRT